MSITIRISGIRKPEKLDAMIDFKSRCEMLGINYPPELVEYFRGTNALSSLDNVEARREATEVDLRDLKINGLVTGGVYELAGCVVDVTQLPDDIDKIRIWASA